MAELRQEAGYPVIQHQLYDLSALRAEDSGTARWVGSSNRECPSLRWGPIGPWEKAGATSSRSLRTRVFTAQWQFSALPT